MYNKLTQSQSTIVSARDTKPVFHNSRDEQTMLKNPFSQTLPLKFPKNTIRKQTSQTMLSQTMYNHHYAGKILSPLVSEYTNTPTEVVFLKMFLYL